eukprot:353069-Pelagomonas_calceolata.AAC.1
MESFKSGQHLLVNIATLRVCCRQLSISRAGYHPKSGGERGKARYTLLELHADRLIWRGMSHVCCLSAGMAAQHRREESGTRADQLTKLALHQKQHPRHMARDEEKCANTQKDAPQKKDKREGAHGKPALVFLSRVEDNLVCHRKPKRLSVCVDTASVSSNMPAYLGNHEIQMKEGCQCVIRIAYTNLRSLGTEMCGTKKRKERGITPAKIAACSKERFPN